MIQPETKAVHDLWFSGDLSPAIGSMLRLAVPKWKSTGAEPGGSLLSWSEVAVGEHRWESIRLRESSLRFGLWSAPPGQVRD